MQIQVNNEEVLEVFITQEGLRELFDSTFNTIYASKAKFLPALNKKQQKEFFKLLGKVCDFCECHQIS